MVQNQEITIEELHKMNTPEIIQLAESLHIKTHNMSKLQIIKLILGLPPSVLTEPVEQEQNNQRF